MTGRTGTAVIRVFSVIKQVFAREFALWRSAFDRQCFVQRRGDAHLHARGEAAAFAGALHGLVSDGGGAGLYDGMVVELMLREEGIERLGTEVALDRVFGIGFFSRGGGVFSHVKDLVRQCLVRSGAILYL